MTEPPAIGVVTGEQLAGLAAEAPDPTPPSPPPPGPTPSANGTYKSRLLVDRWLTDRGVQFRVKAEPDGKGRTVYVLAACPFDASHADPDACVMQAPDGKLAAKCFHNSCQGSGWAAFKAAIGAPEAHHYYPPLRPAKRKKRSANRPSGDTTGPEASAPPPPGATTSARGTVTIDPQNVPVLGTMAQITDTLLTAGDCYRRADQAVRVHDDTITPVLSPPELAGLVNHHAEVVVVGDDGAEYKPLPTAYANVWLNHPGQSARLPVITLFTHNPVFTLDWRLTPAGYDPGSGIYYAGPAVEPRGGTEHLDRLLADFCFRTPADRTNYVGMLVTAVLMPHFIGSKPAVLFNGNQPGLGKSILAQLIAILRDGRPTETASYNPNDEEFEKRLGAIVRRGATTIVIDNAKGKPGRAPRIESACLERSITDPILSFRLLGHSREIRAENSHIFCLTANTPDVGRDLVTRSVVVGLFHEGDPTRRTFTILDPEGYAQEHRLELLGELLGLVDRWLVAGSPRADAPSRFNKRGWGPVVGGVLQAAGLPDFLGNAADAAEELDETRREFAALVALLLDHPQGAWTGSALAEYAYGEGLFPTELADSNPRGRATRLGQIATRFAGEVFRLPDGREAKFVRGDDGKKSHYRVVWSNADRHGF